PWVVFPLRAQATQLPDYPIIFVKRVRCCRIRLPTSILLAQSSYFSAALGQHQQYINSHYIAGGQNGNN
ncbi:hypothetical protein, partial [Microcoleus sp.]|uniref:hypothetical protein n=1 Tax=Microcoleus sp. TaxID=44472 RepID=UPI00403E9C42